MKTYLELAKNVFEAANDHAIAINEETIPDINWEKLGEENPKVQECFLEGTKPTIALVDDEWRAAIAAILDETGNAMTDIDTKYLAIRNKLVALIEHERG